jgi:hypothetical protein
MPPGGAAAGGVAPGSVTTTPVPPVDWRARVDEFLSRLDRRPGETPGMMFFRYWGTNPFVEASSDPLSTFAVDVDTASYTIARAYFYDRGMLPPREAIRTEEFHPLKRRAAGADGPARGHAGSGLESLRPRGTTAPGRGAPGVPGNRRRRGLRWACRHRPPGSMRQNCWLVRRLQPRPSLMGTVGIAFSIAGRA